MRDGFLPGQERSTNRRKRDERESEATEVEGAGEVADRVGGDAGEREVHPPGSQILTFFIFFVILTMPVSDASVDGDS